MSDLAIGLRVLGSQVESFGQALVDRGVALEVWTAALLAGAIVVDRALARRARASLRIALYAPVALRIFLPLDWRIPIASAPSVATYLGPLTHVASHPAAEPSTGQTPSWHALAAVLYVVVAALLATRAVVARVRLARSLAGARPIAAPSPGQPWPLVELVEHEELGPMAVGLLAPRIVLPRRLLAPGEESALACVLRHEAAHLRRCDAWLSAAMELLAVVAWAVLPLWVAIARVRQLMELACDEAALSGAGTAERRRYGHALLDLAEWRSFAVIPSAPSVAFGAGELHFGSTLRARIEALASQRHWPLALQAVTLTFVPVALLVACSGASPSPPAPPASATAAVERAPVDTDYGYAFDVDSARAAAEKGPASPLNADGRVAPEAIQATIRADYGALLTCYAAGRSKNPTLAGTVAVKLVVGADGVVTSSGVDAASTLPDADVARCVATDLGKLRYPAGPGVLTILYPVQLSP